jgi:hypothetical protein
MGKVLLVSILDKCLSDLLRLESKLIVAACWDACVIRGIFRVRNVTNVTHFRLRHFPINEANTCVALSTTIWINYE